MRYYCHSCHKSVTSELPSDSIIRAVLICPECIENKKVDLNIDREKEYTVFDYPDGYKEK